MNIEECEKCGNYVCPTCGKCYSACCENAKCENTDWETWQQIFDKEIPI